MRWQQIVKSVKKIINVIFIRHLMSIVPPAQKHGNAIYVIIKQLFVSILLKNIAQSDL